MYGAVQAAAGGLAALAGCPVVGGKGPLLLCPVAVMCEIWILGCSFPFSSPKSRGETRPCHPRPLTAAADFKGDPAGKIATGLCQEFMHSRDVVCLDN